MRLAPSVLAFLTLQFLTGCAVGHGAMPFRADGVPLESETVAYNWEKYRIEVSFHRSGTNSHWFMIVRDSWDILDQSLQRDGKIWGATDSRCSTADGLRIIDQSLARFRKIRPNARLESVNVEMQVISDLWRDILTGVAATLVNAKGQKAAGFSDGPTELFESLRDALNESATVAELKNILRRHGVQVVYVGTSGQILFKNSLDGQAWGEIASRPDLGIALPGVVEFGLQLQ